MAHYFLLGTRDETDTGYTPVLFDWEGEEYVLFFAEYDRARAALEQLEQAAKGHGLRILKVPDAGADWFEQHYKVVLVRDEDFLDDWSHLNVSDN